MLGCCGHSSPRIGLRSTGFQPVPCIRTGYQPVLRRPDSIIIVPGGGNQRSEVMLTRLITDRRAWTRATLDAPGNWYFTLPGAVLDMLDREIAVWRRRPVPTTELRAGGDLIRAGAVALKPVRDE